MAQTCGTHQGAEVMSAWFEVSGDLQSVNEERGETRDEDEGQGEQWGWSEDKGELVALVSRATVALEGSRCGSRNRIPSSTLGLPLHFQCHAQLYVILALGSGCLEDKWISLTAERYAQHAPALRAPLTTI